MNAPSRPTPSPRIGTPQHFRWLHGIVAVTLVLNLIDAVLTLFWVGAGLASEANPLLAELVEHHPVFFALAKLGLVGLGSLLLWWLRDRPLAVIGIFGAFVVYYLILLHHLRFLSQLVRAWLV
ncbi:MAG: DUF5658 family protein [Myxococcota bacterium]|nr:DUF5658 family protein [Myxococcota bacterium]